MNLLLPSFSFLSPPGADAGCGAGLALCVGRTEGEVGTAGPSSPGEERRKVALPCCHHPGGLPATQFWVSYVGGDAWLLSVFCRPVLCCKWGASLPDAECMRFWCTGAVVLDVVENYYFAVSLMKKVNPCPPPVIQWVLSGSSLSLEATILLSSQGME